MATNISPIITNESRKVTVKVNFAQDRDRAKRKPILKEMQEREYHFLNSDLQGIFDDLIKT